MEGCDATDKQYAKGKIVLVNGYLRYETYKAIVEAGAVGFITFSGDVYDTKETNDLDIRELRSQLGELGKIPGVHMRTKDAMDLVRMQPKMVTLTLVEQEMQTESQNVMVEMTGTSVPEEVITFTAHYDSVYFSTGVYDNGAGTVILMELYRYFMEHAPKRTLRFLWCGSEERGLLGSKAYINQAKEDELQKIVLSINVDVAGAVLGRDEAIVTGDMSLVHAVDYMAKASGFPLGVTQDIYSSDCIPFADKGIPAINFMRFGTSGAAHIHDRYDTLYFLSKESLANTAEFIKHFATYMVNAVVFPVPRIIPQNIVEKVNKYLIKEK